mmetsp:Transcript_8545/g.21583  ORF Transcript_8545/g.21583 Transcript_8545/m.21583 type:complete len:819 (-) Transcript_8545:19-2475(-)
MGNLFRSEEMSLVQLFVPFDAAHDTVDELGLNGLVQFRDLNHDTNPFQRNFVNEIRRCDEMERRVRFFTEQVEKAELPLTPTPPESFATPSSRAHIEELEGKFEELEREVLQMNNNQQTLDRNYNELIELRYVLEKDADFFQTGSGDVVEEQPRESERVALMEDGVGLNAVGFGFLTGVLLREKVESFQRVMWRAMRGNLVMRTSDIEQPLKDPQNGQMVEKTVFIVFFQGRHSQARIKKICESFGANLYTCPEASSERRTMHEQVQHRLSDLEMVLNQTKEHNMRTLAMLADNVVNWNEAVVKEKSIYHTLNMFNYDVGRKCLIGEGWCPTTGIAGVQAALKAATDRAMSNVPAVLNIIASKDTPPTHFTTNRFTRGYQAIVDAYGIGRYREVNPGVFTIITFPFLFGVMFGDVGHGLMMFLFALWMCLNEKKLGSQQNNEIFQTMFDGRYVLLLMAIFAVYVGLLYNDAFSIPLQFFSSTWDFEKGGVEGEFAVQKDKNSVYPFGIDWQWKLAKNSLDYANSLKMKSSVVLGVTQMVLGIILSAINAVHFRKPLNFFFEFIPQMIFMMSTFGYMVFLIFFKWMVRTVEDDPPRILNVMIKMFLSPMNVDDEYYLYSKGSSTQLRVQQILLVLTFVSVPVMLLVKPLLLRRAHNKKMREQQYQPVAQDEQQSSLAVGGGGHGGHDEEFDFGEIFVHQAIHTIEFVLGAVSNTASYLRLWALSLAHAELSEVFWDMILLRVLKPSKGIPVNAGMIFVGWAVWAVFTVGVLLVMESLSAFLHALRLHWVEFQNKFYQGDGYQFVPFSYKLILTSSEGGI